MQQRESVLSALEMMRQNLKETLKETYALRRFAIEEEVLTGAENINKTCNSALRYATELQAILAASNLRIEATISRTHSRIS
jgi:hypothetical protein